MIKQDKVTTNIPRQPFDESYGLKAPENYERYFAPVIGEPLAKDLIRYAALKPGEHVLDVACGTGTVARLAVNQVGDTGTVAGLDINPGMLEVARSVTPPDMPIAWYKASAEAMPMRDETFDVVFCQLGLQFVNDKIAALQEMRRVLVPEGRLILNVPGPAGRIFTILTELLENHISSEAAGFVSHVFSLHENSRLKDLLNKAGLGSIDIRAESKEMSLSPPKKFFWEYVHSTPLAGLLAEVDDETRSILEQAIVEQWQPFTKNGVLKYQQRIVTASALR